MRDKSFAEVIQRTIWGTGNLETPEFNKDFNEEFLKEAETAAEKGRNPTMLKEKKQSSKAISCIQVLTPKRRL